MIIINRGMQCLPHARFENSDASKLKRIRPRRVHNGNNLFNWSKRDNSLYNTLRIARYQSSNPECDLFNNSESRPYVYLSDGRSHVMSYFIDSLYQLKLIHKYQMSNEENIFLDAKDNYYIDNGFNFMMAHGYSRKHGNDDKIHKLFKLQRLRKR